MEEEVRVVEETDEHYLIEKLDGSMVKAYKIDQRDIVAAHIAGVNKIAKALEPRDVMHLVHLIENILNFEPTISEYLDMATNLGNVIGDLYDRVGNPNLLHHPHKNIHPECYGTAQTLRDECVKLLKLLWEVLEEQERGNRIGDVRYSVAEMTRIVLYVANHQIKFSRQRECTYTTTKIS